MRTHSIACAGTIVILLNSPLHPLPSTKADVWSFHDPLLIPTDTSSDNESMSRAYSPEVVKGDKLYVVYGQAHFPCDRQLCPADSFNLLCLSSSDGGRTWDNFHLPVGLDGPEAFGAPDLWWTGFTAESVYSNGEVCSVLKAGDNEHFFYGPLYTVTISSNFAFIGRIDAAGESVEYFSLCKTANYNVVATAAGVYRDAEGSFEGWVEVAILGQWGEPYVGAGSGELYWDAPYLHYAYFSRPWDYDDPEGSASSWALIYRRSADEGLTWSDPREVAVWRGDTYWSGVGRLVCGIAANGETIAIIMENAQRGYEAQVTAYYSTDGGETWSTAFSDEYGWAPLDLILDDDNFLHWLKKGNVGHDYLSYGALSLSTFYRYNDPNLSAFDRNSADLWFDGTEAYLVWVGDDGNLWLSTTGRLPAVESLLINPSNEEFNVTDDMDRSIQLQCLVLYDDGSTTYVTDQVIWTYRCDEPAVAVNQSGLLDTRGLHTSATITVYVQYQHGLDTYTGSRTYGLVVDSPDDECVPSLVSPSSDAVMDNGCRDGQDGVSWRFDWSSCSGADQYHLYVIGPNDNVAMIDDSDIDSSSYDFDRFGGYISDDNRLGWRWRVRAWVDGDWGDWTTERIFNVEPLNADCADSEEPGLAPEATEPVPPSTEAPSVDTGEGSGARACGLGMALPVAVLGTVLLFARQRRQDPLLQPVVGPPYWQRVEGVVLPGQRRNPLQRRRHGQGV